MKTIILAVSAAKELDRLPPDARNSLSQKLQAYAIDGFGDVKAMAHGPAKRLRDGDYRAIFNETKTEIVVLVVGHRREIYR